MFLSHAQHYKDAICHAKSVYYTSIIESKKIEGNSCNLFSTLHNIVKPPDTLATHTHSAAACNKFMDFFIPRL